MRIERNNVIPFAYRRSDGMGVVDYLSLAKAFIGGGDGGGGGRPGGGGGAGGNPGFQKPSSSPITVSPAIQTTISPQISPVFQQSYMSRDSAQTAGTTQLAPSTQTALTGRPSEEPGAGARRPVGSNVPTDAGGYPDLPGDGEEFFPAGAGSNPEGSFQRYLPFIVGGIAIIGLALIFKSMRNKK